MSTTVETDIRPFHVEISEEEQAELRRRIAATRWPSQELVADRSQGVQLATLQALARYWTTDYDWRKTEAKLNALPQFATEIDGVDTHFIHVKSRHEDALPLIMTHGWPGSVIELLEVVGPLTDPTAHGGSAEDAFHLVLPSIPGYGFSGEPREIGWGPDRVARAWPVLMQRLGYTRYVAQGGDVGASVTDAMGHQAPEGLIGIHMNLLVTALAGPQPAESEQERAAADALATFRASGFGYFLEQATRPQTIGYRPLRRLGRARSLRRRAASRVQVIALIGARGRRATMRAARRPVDEPATPGVTRPGAPSAKDDAPDADEPRPVGRAAEADDLDPAAGVRRVDHPSAPDVDPDMPETGEEEQIAALHPGPCNVSTLVVERVRAVREFDAQSPVRPVDESGTVEAGRGRAAPPIRDAHLSHGDRRRSFPNGPLLLDHARRLVSCRPEE
jgi:Epoxide hydrolase N terminus